MKDTHHFLSIVPVLFHWWGLEAIDIRRQTNINGFQGHPGRGVPRPPLSGLRPAHYASRRPGGVPRVWVELKVKKVMVVWMMRRIKVMVVWMMRRIKVMVVWMMRRIKVMVVLMNHTLVLLRLNQTSAFCETNNMWL